MTDITTWQPAQTTQAAAIDNQTRAVANLRDWATSADAAYTVAERLVQSSFVPAQFKGKPIEACSAILDRRSPAGQRDARTGWPRSRRPR